MGANRLTISAANRLIERSPAERIAAAPLFLRRLAYPRHFARLVATNASDFQIDPRLLYSLVLQESLFEPQARSYAGARNAYTWFHYTAPDEALFIYKLPYTETGRYLRRVLTHYYHYTRLYPR